MNVAIGERQRAEQSSQPLKWLSSILWPEGQARLVPGQGTGAVVGAGNGEIHVGLQWWASPGSDEARILIPATSREGARTAVRRYHDGFTIGRRVRSWAAETAMRSPTLAWTLLGANVVTVEGRPTEGVLSALAETLAAGNPHLTELHVAVSLAAPKSNRKPVLQLIDQDGVCLGWAKIGWNDWTTGLLDNEARWLQTHPELPLITPNLIEDLTIGGQKVVVTSGAVAGRWPKRWRPRPDPALVMAVANLGSRTTAPLADLPWWSSVEEVLPVATASESAAIERVVADTKGLVFETGCWHGDLTPWNIMTAPVPKAGISRFLPRFNDVVYQVIDWEFAADGVPLGLDLCHYHTQVASEMKHVSAAQALDHSARLSPQGLAELGIDPHNQIAVYRLYLVELIRRTLALRAAGMPLGEVKQGTAAVRRIRADLLSPTPSRSTLENQRTPTAHAQR